MLRGFGCTFKQTNVRLNRHFSPKSITQLGFDFQLLHPHHHLFTLFQTGVRFIKGAQNNVAQHRRTHPDAQVPMAVRNQNIVVGLLGHLGVLHGEQIGALDGSYVFCDNLLCSILHLEYER